jgi:serine/threonine protein kinase
MCPPKADVFSLGNIFYMLLQGEWPFEEVSSETAAELVKNGTRPTIYLDLWYSDDPVNMVLKEVMMICHAQDPKERATARDVETILKQKMRELDPGQLEKWGLS